MTAALDHLTADELDALHTGGASERATSHLATCTDCRSMFALDTALVAGLRTLPTWEPSAGFIERVMTELDLAAPVAQVAAPSTDRAIAARKRVLIGGLVTTGIVAGGFAWAAANPGAALGFAVPALQDVGQTLWLSLQALTANTVEQPWFGAVRDTLASPGRALPLLAAAAGAYTVVLLGLRRLLTRPATDAGW